MFEPTIGRTRLKWYLVHAAPPHQSTDVTANGFIAGWIVKLLLESGFSVRGTVRSAEKADGIRSAIATGTDRLEFVVVEDITVVRATLSSRAPHTPSGSKSSHSQERLTMP